MKPDIEVGDWVMTPSGKVHWLVCNIESRIDPLGVVIHSGQTNRVRRETYGNLILFKKGRNL